MQHRATDTEIDALREMEHRKRLFRFDPKVDSGTIIQILVLVTGGALAYGKIDGAITLLTSRSTVIEQRAAEAEKRTEATLAEMKADLRETGQRVQDLRTKIDLIDLKVTQQQGRAAP